nr:unnamed protein product [Callosobruchus chinensis]
MNGSQEQLIELTEIRGKSPSKTKIKRNNKVEQSQCSNSICSTSDESNIISIFSTTEHSLSTRGNELKEPSISLTDSVFAKPGPSGSKRQESGQFYRQKISEHLKKIRQKASISANQQIVKSVKSEEKDTPRSVDIIGTCSNRFNVDLTSSNDGRRQFFIFINEEQKETPEDDGKSFIYYVSPEHLNFVIRLNEKESFFKPKSCEHLFAEKLRQLCEEYIKNNTKELKQRLDQLRSEKEKIGDEKNASGDSEDTEGCNISKEIKKLRTRYFRELEKERRCLKSILEVWRHIKTIRERQGYSSTSVNLKILKIPVDPDADTDAYHKEFDITLREMMLEHKAKEAKDTDSDSMASSVKNDEDKLKQKLTKRFKKVMKQPGEPAVSFVLSKSIKSLKMCLALKKNQGETP